MNAKHAFLAAVTGFAGFMITTVAITDLLESQVGFSIFVGLPAGILVGLITTWYVYTRQTRGTPGSSGPRVSTALVAAAVAFIVAMALGVTFGGGATTSLIIAVAIAVVAGIAMYLKGPDTL